MESRESFLRNGAIVLMTPSIYNKLINAKNVIQRDVLNIATNDELQDVKNNIYNSRLERKLLAIANKMWEEDGCGEISLYCVSMGVATIMKEYGWINISNDSLCDVAIKIESFIE